MSYESDLRAAYRDWCWVFEEPERKAKRQRDEHERSMWFYRMARNAFADPICQQQSAMGLQALTPEQLAKYQHLPKAGWLGLGSIVGGIGGRLP